MPVADAPLAPPFSLRVCRLGHQRQRRREHARRGRRRRGQGHVQVDRAPVVVVVLFVAFDRSSSWRVLGKFGRWRWKMLIECAHAPICCGCYVFLFGFRNRRPPSPCQRAVPNPGRFSIVVCVSRVLFSSSGGALVARSGKIWSLDGRCLPSLPTRLFVVAVACFCSDLSISSRNLPVPMSAPNPGRFRSSFRCLECVPLLLVAFWEMWISANFVPDYRHHM